MFSNLIESSSHHNELARKGRFFLATLISYSLIFLCAGVASIYAYDAHLENQNLEMLTLVAPPEVPVEASVEQVVKTKTTANGSEEKDRLPVRTELIAQINNSTNAPEKVSNIPSNVPEMPPGKFKLGEVNTPGSGGGPYDKNLPPGTGGPDPSGEPGRPVVDVNTLGTPPPIKEPVKKNVVVSKGVINGQATYKPKPVYPAMAIKTRVQGVVNVQILVDEKGRVLSAHAYSGHVLLRQAAEQAALQTRFSPTFLSEEPVKVSGTITFNFVLN